VYYVVTMLSQSHHPLCQQVATPFSVAQPLLAVSRKSLCKPVTTLDPHPILRNPYLGVVGVARVLDMRKPETEPEQFIENARLTEARKVNLGNLLKIQGRVWGKIFC
jgi:hypothetical protein